MPVTIIAPQLGSKTASEVRNAAVSLVSILDSGELLTGTPTVLEVTTTDLTLANKAVNTEALTVNGLAVAIGQAVVFNVAGGTAGTTYQTYQIQIVVDTDATPAQRLYINTKLRVTADA